jgi:hypothetical protein
VDYAALLALVAVAFAGAGAATGFARGMPGQVTHAVQTAICIVGGDVCRSVDAAAEGLAPCVVDDRTNGGDVTIEVVALRFGEAGEWSVARRSDGTVLVTHNTDRRVGFGAGFGFELGGLEAGIQGSLDGSLATGAAWELPDVGAATRFLAAVRDGEKPSAPTWRFGGLGEEADVRGGFDGHGFELSGVEASWRAAAGARVGKGETTLYLDAGTALRDPFGTLPSDPEHGTSDAPGGARTGPLLFALTRDAHGLRELAFRRVQNGARPGEIVETVGRLDLRDPENRAVADRLLRVRLPWPPSIARDLRAVLLRTVQAGTVERSVYAVDDRSRDFTFAGRLVIELGIDASKIDVARRLVDASAWTHGSPERRRVDCLGDKSEWGGGEFADGAPA